MDTTNLQSGLSVVHPSLVIFSFTRFQAVHAFIENNLSTHNIDPKQNNKTPKLFFFSNLNLQQWEKYSLQLICYGWSKAILSQNQ